MFYRETLNFFYVPPLAYIRHTQYSFCQRKLLNSWHIVTNLFRIIHLEQKTRLTERKKLQDFLPIDENSRSLNGSVRLTLTVCRDLSKLGGKFPIHKSELASLVNIDNSEKLIHKQRCDQVLSSSKRNLPITIHPPYLCHCMWNRSVKIKIWYLKGLLSPGLVRQLRSDGCVARGVFIFQDIAKVWS